MLSIRDHHSATYGTTLPDRRFSFPRVFNDSILHHRRRREKNASAGRRDASFRGTPSVPRGRAPFEHSPPDSLAHVNDEQTEIRREKMRCDDRDVAATRAEIDRPNEARRGEARATETIASAPPTPLEGEKVNPQELSDLLDFVGDEVWPTRVLAPQTRYCSSCRKHLVEAHFRSQETKTCVVCLRMHKMYQRRRRKR